MQKSLPVYWCSLMLTTHQEGYLKNDSVSSSETCNIALL